MVEFQKTEKKFFKDFKKDISKIEDPRHQSYIDYRIEEVIYPVIMKNACNLQSMREMTESFNTTKIIRNTGMILSNEELPHYVTINDCLKKLNPEELEKIRTKMIKILS